MTAAAESSPPARPRWTFWVFVVGMLALVVLFLGLGKWQLDRLAWKEGLIAQVAADRHVCADRSVMARHTVALTRRRRLDRRQHLARNAEERKRR